jgi:Concanavalin A-like lectin/glucanases superfamily
MNRGLLGWPKGRELSPSLFGWPLGTSEHSLEGPRRSLLDLARRDSAQLIWGMQEASGFPRDLSLRNRHVDSFVGGTPTFQAAGPVGDYAIQFAASNQLQTSAIMVPPDVNNLAIEFVASIPTASGSWLPVYYNGNTGANGFGVGMTTTGKLQLLLGGIAFQTSQNTAVAGIGFFHFALVRSAGTWTYYLNGVSDGSPTTAGFNSPTSGPVVVGGPVASTLISYFAYYETALTAAQVAEHSGALF